MALEYALTLAGDTAADRVAVRALPDLVERPTGTPQSLAIDLYDRYGFDLTVHAARHAYLDVAADQGRWEWEPEAYVSVGFRMDRDADHQWEVVNMLTAVRRILQSGPEDAALVLNGDILLLTRLSGVLTKHRRDGWWTSYPAANDVFPS